MNQLLIFKNLEPYSHLSHGISTRHSEAEQQYDVIAEQVHDNKFVWVDRPLDNIVPGVDALLTSTPNVRLRAGVSDCVPIIIYDPVTHSGGVVHAGFQGTTREIIKHVLAEFNTKNVFIGIGPAIGPCCYDEIDLQVENYHQAIEMGVAENQIEVMDICTLCNQDTFFSFRGGDNVNFGAYFELI